MIILKNIRGWGWAQPQPQPQPQPQKIFSNIFDIQNIEKIIKKLL